MAGDSLELGFVSSLALQNLSVEYFGQPYVHHDPNILPAADIERGGGAFAVPMQDTHLGKA